MWNLIRNSSCKGVVAPHSWYYLVVLELNSLFVHHPQWCLSKYWTTKIIRNHSCCVWFFKDFFVQGFSHFLNLFLLHDSDEVWGVRHVMNNLASRKSAIITCFRQLSPYFIELSRLHPCDVCPFIKDLYDAMIKGKPFPPYCSVGLKATSLQLCFGV